MRQGKKSGIAQGQCFQGLGASIRTGELKSQRQIIADHERNDSACPANR